MNRTRDYTVYARIDIRDIASIIKFMEKSGVPASSRSYAIFRGMGLFADLLHDNGIVERIDDTEEALQYLENMSLGPERKGDLSRIMKQVSRESLMKGLKESEDTVDPADYSQGMQEVLANVQKDLVDKA